MTYDSTADTQKHIGRVQQLLAMFSEELLQRAIVHDQSKLMPPEKEHFDRETPLLKDLVYGSEEYQASLKRLGVALEHHYKHNSHHPEHYDHGIDGMDLFDLVEMFLDWKAASERTAGSALNLSVSFKRFAVDDQLKMIMRNTATRLKWEIK